MSLQWNCGILTTGPQGSLSTSSPVSVIVRCQEQRGHQAMAQGALAIIIIIAGGGIFRQPLRAPLFEAPSGVLLPGPPVVFIATSWVSVSTVLKVLVNQSGQGQKTVWTQALLPIVKEETDRDGLHCRPGCELQATRRVTFPMDFDLCAWCLQKWHTNGKPDLPDKRDSGLVP